MINAMQKLALDFLYEKIGNEEDINNLEKWFSEINKKNPYKILPFLIEAIPSDRKVLILEADKNDVELLNVIASEIKDETDKYPFVKPSSGNSPQIGPILKLGYSAKQGFSPKPKIMKKTLEKWQIIAESENDYSDYFEDIIEILKRPKINILNKDVVLWKEKNFNNPIDCLIAKEGNNFKDSIIAIRNSNNELPGESKKYSQYLQENLIKEKYMPNKLDRVFDKTCSLCEKSNIEVYANGLKGAGINLGNIDRIGSFSGLELQNAWKNFAICSDCADLIYIFKNHTLKENPQTKRKPYQMYIAGEKTLILPELSDNLDNRKKLLKRINNVISLSEESTITVEERLWKVLLEEKAILNLNFYWLKIGQSIEDLQGSIQDVLPSRLKKISEFNLESRKWKSAIFPENHINDLSQVDLSLNSLKLTFRRPGGEKAKKINKSENLKRLRREIAGNIYHKTKIQEKRFWTEIMITAEYYLKEIVEKGDAYSLLNEGKTKQGKTYLTFAGWIRHLAWWLYYLKKMEVMKMNGEIYCPQSELLKPYFAEESGIDSMEKAFAFTLGVLYGRLLLLQGAKKINVSSNALTWLKRLTLKGADLPELYVKTRQKLLAYDAEGNENVREVIKELGSLGIKLGDNIKLDSIATNYFLLLGQSMSNTVIPSKKDEEKKEN